MNPRQEPLARQATPAATAHRQDARLRRFLVGHVLGKRTATAASHGPREALVLPAAAPDLAPPWAPDSADHKH